MTFAHAATSTGPHAEYLLVAIGFFVLGTILFVQKTAHPLICLLLVALALTVGTGAFVLKDEPAAAGRRVVILSPKPGDVVPAGEPVAIEVGVQGGKLASSASATDGGHLHVFVNDLLEKMPVTPEPTISLKKGRHKLGVEYVDANHRSFSPKVYDEIEVRAR